VARWWRWLAWLVVLLVLAQAFFAGRWLTYGGNALDIHAGIADVTFLAVVAQTVLAFVAGPRGADRRLLLGLGVVLVVLTAAQIGLGYAGHNNGGEAKALHIPNGVLILGLATFNATLLRRGARPASAS
jgi:4-amino-4-deoxy-L-arabinose transferase-like glycosyltransferase